MIRKTLHSQKHYILFIASLACMFFFFPFIKKTIFKKHFDFNSEQQKYLTSYFFAWSVQYILFWIILIFWILNNIFRIDTFYYIQLFTIIFLTFRTIFSLALIWLHKQFFIRNIISQYKIVKNFFFMFFLQK